ncbi:hypothetical protein LLY42_26720 [Pseudomonas frederiksbergensis]|nr:hypothetical protein LLY42_26720 [Pseudomonas frederiksbergensis]
MDLTNKVQFNKVVDAVFGKLAQSFPVPVTLEAQDLGLASEPLGAYVDGEWKPSDAVSQHEFFFDTVAWLVSSGYLAATRNFGESKFENAVLTEKLLQCTKSIPISLKF